MIEAIAKILDAVAKYAWGIFIVCLFVLILPKELAKDIGILEIRTQFLGYWWICLVFSCSIWIGSLLSKIGQWISAHRDSKERSAKSARMKQTIIARLDSLSDSEHKWIAYCLLKNVQTLHATQIHPTANSFLSKGIVNMGTGSILSLPFTIVDFVWEYLLENRDAFLPPDVANNPQIAGNLERFERSLREIV